MGLFGWLLGSDSKSRDDYDSGYDDGYTFSGHRGGKKRKSAYDEGYSDGEIDAFEEWEED